MCYGGGGLRPPVLREHEPWADHGELGDPGLEGGTNAESERCKRPAALMVYTRRSEQSVADGALGGEIRPQRPLVVGWGRAGAGRGQGGSRVGAGRGRVCACVCACGALGRPAPAAARPDSAGAIGCTDGAGRATMRVSQQSRRAWKPVTGWADRLSVRRGRRGPLRVC